MGSLGDFLGDLSDAMELIDTPPAHAYVYNDDGSAIVCPMCGEEMIFNDENQYACSVCGHVMDRGTYFDYIGVEPAGPNCADCDCLYPGCTSCPYGYV